MADAKYKHNDKITDIEGQVWRRTQGGNWRGEGGKQGGKLYSGKGDPQIKATDTTTTPSDPTYQPYLTAIDKLAGKDSELKQGLLGGLDLGKAMYGEGSLGRSDETVSPELTDIQNTLKAKASETGYDPLVQEALNLRRASLSGMSPEAMLAAREQGQAGINRSLSSGIRTLGNAVGGPRGNAFGIQALPILAQAAQSQAGLERGLTMDNENLKQKNLDSFTSEAGRAAEFNITSRRNQYNDYVNFSTGLRSDLYSRHLDNLNRIAMEKSGMQSSIFGGGAFKSEQLGREAADKLAQENLDFQKSMWKSGNSGKSSGSTGGGSSSGADNSDSFG